MKFLFEGHVVVEKNGYFEKNCNEQSFAFNFKAKYKKNIEIKSSRYQTTSTTAIKH